MAVILPLLQRQALGDGEDLSAPANAIINRWIGENCDQNATTTDSASAPPVSTSVGSSENIVTTVEAPEAERGNCPIAYVRDETYGQDAVSTAHGELEIVGLGHPRMPEEECLYINGALVQNIGYYYNNRFQAHFTRDNHDVVVICGSCGGTACVQSCRFITVNSDHNVIVSAHVPFQYSDEIFESGGLIVVPGGMDRGTVVQSIYDDGQVLIVETPIDPFQPVPERECQYYYNTFRDLCLEGRGGRCLDDLGFSVQARNFRYMQEDPRVNHIGFNDLCGRVCGTNVSIRYEVFRSGVCGSNR